MSAVPVQKPIIISRPRPNLRVEEGVRPSLLRQVLAHTLAFSVLTMFVFLASSLVGQVLVEKARREGIHAVTRAKIAAKEESLLRTRVQAMTSSSAIDSWAQENGFIAPEQLASAGGDANAQAAH